MSASTTDHTSSVNLSPRRERRQILGAAARGQAGFVAPLIATLALALFAIVVGASYATYAQRATADNLREPQFEITRASDGSVLFSGTSDTLADARPFPVIAFDAPSDDYPRPPGFPQLAPGEVALSPQLRQDGASENIDARYGRFTGEIPTSVLEVPDERVAYVRTTTGQLAGSTWQLNGFGANISTPWSTGSFVGESIAIPSLAETLAVIIILVGLPAYGVVLAMVRMRARARARRSLLLEALGAPLSLRRVVTMRDALPGAVSGLILALGVAGWCAATGRRVPLTGFLLSADTVLNAPALIGALLAMVIVVVSFAWQPRATRRIRPQWRAESLPVWLLPAGPILLIATIQVAHLAASQSSLALLWAYRLGMLVTVIVMPLTAGQLIGLLGALLRIVARSLHWPSWLVAGAWISTSVRQVATIAAVLLLGTGVAFQAFINSSLLGAPAREGMALQQRIGPGFAFVKSEHSTIPPATLGTGPAGITFAGLRDAGGRGMVVSGDCAVLRQLTLPCRGSSLPVAQLSARTRDLVNEAGFGPIDRVQVQAGPLGASKGTTLLAVAPAGAALDLPALKAWAYRLPGFPDVALPGDNWIRGVTGPAFYSRWIVVYGLVGSSFLVLAVLAATTGLRAQHASRLAPVIAMYGDRGRSWRVAALSAGLPFLLSGCIATLTGWTLAAPRRSDLGDPALLDQLALAFIGISVIGAVASTVAMARASRAAALTWQPGSGE